MANTRADNKAKDAPVADDKATTETADKSAEQEGQDSTPSDDVQAQFEQEQKAVEDNPDAPEEAVETEYLPGGEIPVNAPGTEGIARA